MGLALTSNPVCPYCDQVAELVTGAAIYAGRKDIAERWFWRCVPCDARVGCHPGTQAPLGTLANAETRRARSAAHEAFDQLWRKPSRRRGKRLMFRWAAYRWLADELGVEEVHIGSSDLGTCQRIVELSKKKLSELRSES